LHQSRPTPEQIRARLAAAEADLDEVERVNLAVATPADLVALNDKLAASLADMIRLHRERFE
jgi:hypothetical protein